MRSCLSRRRSLPMFPTASSSGCIGVLMTSQWACVSIVLSRKITSSIYNSTALSMPHCAGVYQTRSDVYSQSVDNGIYHNDAATLISQRVNTLKTSFSSRFFTSTNKLICIILVFDALSVSVFVCLCSMFFVFFFY